MKVARGCWVPFRKICSRKHVGVWFWTWTLEFLLVMLGDITSQPWNANVVTPQRFISYSEIILWPRSQEHSRKEREKSGEDGIIERFPGNLAQIPLGKYKEAEMLSSLCGSDPDVRRKLSPPLTVWTQKQREQKGKKKRVQALESDRPGFKFWLYHLLHLWPWSSY